jgi:hypothetical protein
MHARIVFEIHTVLSKQTKSVSYQILFALRSGYLFFSDRLLENLIDRQS